jgi:p-aminobenzoyl-glutamate transporter AbgT
MDTILKSTLKRQIPFLIGGTITGIIMTYYYGFLFTIVVNSIIWFVISMIVNKYYWNYTGFRDEMYLFKKYVINRNKTKEL